MSWMLDKWSDLSCTDRWKDRKKAEKERPRTVCQGHDEWGYVDCSGVMGFAPEAVEKLCNYQSVTVVII